MTKTPGSFAGTPGAPVLGSRPPSLSRLRSPRYGAASRATARRRGFIHRNPTGSQIRFDGGHIVGISFFLSAPLRGASRSSSQRGAGCGGRCDVGPECCGLRVKAGDPLSDRRLTPTRRADGPSACPRDSSCGPGGVGGSDNSRSAMQQAAKSIACGTQAYALRPRLLFAVCFGTRLPRGHPRGAAGAVKRPVFRTPPRGIKGQDDRRALEPDKTRGDDARLGLG